MKNVLIKKVSSIDECRKCNRLLEELICFESQFDSSINSDYKINEFYERTLNRDDSVIFIATHLDNPIGYIMAYKQKPNSAYNGNFISIMNIFVKEDYRNMNIGTMLIAKVEKWAKSIFDSCFIELDCFVDNKTAIDFYAKLNFQNIRIKMRKKV